MTTAKVVQHGADTAPHVFELFVSKGFCGFELAAVTHVLRCANALMTRDLFEWRFVSDKPGLVTGKDGMLVRAEPAIPDHGFGDAMIVVGGNTTAEAWLPRLRAMQRRSLPVVLLSDAATAYIRETGYFPNLTSRFAERSDGVVTAAGAGATAELVIGLIAPWMQSTQVAELGNQLLLHTIRKGDAEQPKDIADNAGLFDARVTEARACRPGT